MKFHVVSRSGRPATPGVETVEYLFNRADEVIGRVIERGSHRTVEVVTR
jgi:hypothetical protein